MISCEFILVAFHEPVAWTSLSQKIAPARGPGSMLGASIILLQTRKTTIEKREKPISILNKEDTYHHLGWTHAVVILARGHRVAGPTLNTILPSFSSPTQKKKF